MLSSHQAMYLFVSLGSVRYVKFLIPSYLSTKPFNIYHVVFYLVGYPVVKLLCGREETIRPERWTVKAMAGILLTRRQLPLKLAWSMSIHKSQVSCWQLISQLINSSCLVH